MAMWKKVWDRGVVGSVLAAAKGSTTDLGALVLILHSIVDLCISYAICHTARNSSPPMQQTSKSPNRARSNPSLKGLSAPVVAFSYSFMPSALCTLRACLMLRSSMISSLPPGIA